MLIGTFGNLFPITVAGPPDKIIPLTFLDIPFFFRSFNVKISEKTLHSLIRLAISFVT